MEGYAKGGIVDFENYCPHFGEDGGRCEHADSVKDVKGLSFCMYINGHTHGYTQVKIDNLERCPVPSKQKAVESMFEKAWRLYTGHIKEYKHLDNAKREFIGALKEAGFTNEPNQD